MHGRPWSDGVAGTWAMQHLTIHQRPSCHEGAVGERYAPELEMPPPNPMAELSLMVQSASASVPTYR